MSRVPSYSRPVLLMIGALATARVRIAIQVLPIGIVEVLPRPSISAIGHDDGNKNASPPGCVLWRSAVCN
jgi:hypothetical protein